MNGTETDKLLAKIAKGDNSAFEQLYIKTRNGVYAFLYSYLKNAHDTEDAMQTVYLKVKMNISSYKIGTNGRAWLLQIAKNHAITLLQKRNRTIMEENSKQPDLFARGEITDLMRRCLNEDEIQIVTLHVLWGYKHREISRQLGIPLGTVTSKYKRSIDKMRKALKEVRDEKV